MNIYGSLILSLSLTIKNEWKVILLNIFKKKTYYSFYYVFIHFIKKKFCYIFS